MGPPVRFDEAIPEGRVRTHQIGVTYADAAHLEDTLPQMQLSPWIVPMVRLPEKPPPAASGFSPGCVGTLASQTALNFSQIGLFNNEILSRLIVRLLSIQITNISGSSVSYRFRRVDLPTGFTFTAWIPPYVSAGTGAGTALGMITDTTEPLAAGDSMAQITIPDGVTLTVPFAGVINNGAITVVPSAVNIECRAAFFFETFPIIHLQEPGA